MEQAAIDWARPYADQGDTSYNGQCLYFDFVAYQAAGANLWNQLDMPTSDDTYPVDIWGHFTSGTTGADTPPVGALVFLSSTPGDRTLSHVALSLGDGNLLSTSDGVAPSTHYERWNNTPMPITWAGGSRTNELPSWRAGDRDRGPVGFTSRSRRSPVVLGGQPLQPQHVVATDGLGWLERSPCKASWTARRAPVTKDGWPGRHRSPMNVWTVREPA